MVRLKQKLKEETKNKLLGLNSTMVRLKQDGFILMVTLKLRLNSTMVRLKLKGVLMIRRKIKLSQFHYGSIKT